MLVPSCGCQCWELRALCTLNQFVECVAHVPVESCCDWETHGALWLVMIRLFVVVGFQFLTVEPEGSMRAACRCLEDLEVWNVWKTRL